MGGELFDCIRCFGNVMCSPFLLGHCAEKGVKISFLTEYGKFLARSVFECNIDPAQCVTLKTLLLSVYSPGQDSLRFYYLGSNYKHKVEHCGAKAAIDVEDPLIL